VIQRTRKCGNW